MRTLAAFLLLVAAADGGEIRGEPRGFVVKLAAGDVLRFPSPATVEILADGSVRILPTEVTGPAPDPTASEFGLAELAAAWKKHHKTDAPEIKALYQGIVDGAGDLTWQQMVAEQMNKPAECSAAGWKAWRASIPPRIDRLGSPPVKLGPIKTNWVRAFTEIAEAL